MGGVVQLQELLHIAGNPANSEPQHWERGTKLSTLDSQLTHFCPSCTKWKLKKNPHSSVIVANELAVKRRTSAVQMNSLEELRRELTKAVFRVGLE